MGQSIIESVERFDLRHGEVAYRISVYRPEGDHASGSLPIVFVTDADYFFGTAAEMLGLQAFSRVLAPAILVGIGYGAGLVEAATRRWRDLTLPTTDAALADVPLIAAMIGPEIGGAEAFLAFLLGDLAAEVTRRYPVAAADRHILFGTSLGGLFASYAVLTRPEAFRALIIGSPALFWDRFAVLKLLPAFADKVRALDHRPRVFIGVGGAERDLPDAVPAGSPITLEQMRGSLIHCRVVDAAGEFAEALRQAGLDAVDYRIFEGEGHQQVVPSQINSGLRLALQPER